MLPEKATNGFAAIMAKLSYLFAVRHRRIAIESLSIAFGQEKDQCEITAIAKACFEIIAKGMVEVLWISEHPDCIKKKARIVGKEHLLKAFKEGRGAIGVSAHFGNFPLLLARLVQEGIKTNAIIRYSRDEKIEKYFEAKRREFGLNTIYSTPRTTCVTNSIKALRNNELLFIPIDQNFGTAGVFVDFFGRQAATATGPVIFAQRTGAPIVPMFIVREKDDTHRIIIEPPMYIEKKEDNAATIQHNISRITKIIEEYIRKYPQEWGWIHRRWKSKPS
ncbi:MAG: lysophospholipid acyltransferase family protein [Candidatus Omnitrophota bacterium]|nr:lysophospholipid acyltransferase family protein [Candidatus Omnitrophota bacterium]